MPSPRRIFRLHFQLSSRGAKLMDIREKFDEQELEEQFDEMLDESYEPFKIGTSTFYASQILNNCDPIMYRIAFDEYVDFLQEQEDEE
jgi:hypothetical protein